MDTMKSVCLIALFFLSPYTCPGQTSPQGWSIAKGAPVPPFFLQRLQGGWQSSEKMFEREYTVLWFDDGYRLDTSTYQVLDQLIARGVGVYIVDVNPFMPLSERKKVYCQRRPISPVLFDHKNFVATAYGVQQTPAWFIVNNEQQLVAYNYEGDIEGLKRGIGE